MEKKHDSYAGFSRFLNPRRLFHRLLGLDLAIICTLTGGVGCVALAFLNSEKAIAFMDRPLPCIGVALSAILLTCCSLRAIWRRRIASAVVHAGFVLVAAGWLWTHIPIAFNLHGEQDLPVTGMMPLIDGDESDMLAVGSQLEKNLGKVPFRVRLEKFIIERYPEGPIREYRSRVTIFEKGKEPYVKNIRVNHPARVGDYDIYQMSWGRTQDPATGITYTYTLLQFIRDPGLPLVFAGYLLLFVGMLICTIRNFSKRPQAQAIN